MTPTPSFPERLAIRWIICGSLLALSGNPASAEDKVTYQDHLLPIIENNCAKCHNPDKKKGDLDLTTYSGLMKGGGSGSVVVAGNPDASKLYRAITHAEEPNMPPNKPRIPDKEIEVFKKWVTGGLLETSGSKALAAAKPTVDLTLKISDAGKPDGPPPMPEHPLFDPVIHSRASAVATGLAISPWAPLVAITSQRQVLLFNLDTLDLAGVVPFTEGQPADVKFSRNGKILIIGGGHGGKSGRVTLWNVVTAERITVIGDEYDTVLAADLSPDQSKVALGGPGRLIKIYATSNGAVLQKIKKHTDWVTALAFSPNGEMLATADRNGGISVWDPDNAQEIHTLAGHKGGVTALSWRSDSKVLASASEDGTIKLWEMQEGKMAKTWNAHNGGVLSVSYARDGKLVSCGRDNQIGLWNADGNRLKAYAGLKDLPVRAVISPTGDRVVGGDWSGRIVVWNATNATSIGELDANPAALPAQLIAAEKSLSEIQGKPGKSTKDIEAAQARVQKLKAARVYADLNRLQQFLTARKLDLEALKANGKPIDKLAREISAAQVQLDKITAEYARVRTAPADVMTQSKL